MNKNTLAIVALASVASLISGCSEKKVERIDAAFVVGVRSNSAIPASNAIASQVPVEPGIGSTISMVGIDGNRDGIRIGSIEVKDVGTEIDSKNRYLAQRSGLFTELKKHPAARPEADVLGAIGAAARSLPALNGARIFVLDSMLSTAGPLDFRQGLLQSSPEDIVDSLRTQNLLPNLKGVEMVLIGQGNVEPPQKQLSERDRQSLRIIWRAVLKASGASEVNEASDAGAIVRADGLPPVSPVVLEPLRALQVQNCEAVIGEDQIRFQPDSAKFANPSAAKDVIASWASKSKDCSGHITVTGTTSSWGTEEGRASVSSARANTVRSLLIEELGADKNTVRAMGVGMNFPEFIPDRDRGNNLIPAMASKNRSVRIRYLR